MNHRGRQSYEINSIAIFEPARELQKSSRAITQKRVLQVIYLLYGGIINLLFAYVLAPSNSQILA